MEPLSGGTSSPAAPAPSVADPDEKAVIRRAQAGDLEAFDQLVRQHQERVYGTIYHMTSNHDDAADLTQDTFIKAYNALRSFKGDCGFFTWLYRIAVNRTLNFLKQRRNRTPHLSLNDLDFNAENDPEIVNLASEHSPRRDSDLTELQQKLNAALLKLSEVHRMVVVMHDIQGMPHDEIATILDCNPGTVRSRLFYARQQLQAYLSDYLK